MSKLRLTFVDLFLAVAFATACVFWSETSGMEDTVKVYPRLVSGLLAFFAIVCFIQERMKDEEVSKNDFSKWLKPVVMIGGVALYIFCIAKIGYFVSSYTYLLIMFQANKWGNDDEFLEEDRLELSSNSRRRHLSSESDDGEGIVTLHQEIVEFYRLCVKSIRLNVLLSLVFQGHVTNSRQSSVEVGGLGQAEECCQWIVARCEDRTIWKFRHRSLPSDK